MKIEFLDDLTAGGRFPYADPMQLVRLYDFDSSEANQLRQVIQKEIIENNKAIELTALDFIQNVNCKVFLIISDTDKGILSKDYIYFSCILTIEKYKEMIFLMEPFCNKDSNGYQWLYDLDTSIDFLFSPGGTW